MDHAYAEEHGLVDAYLKDRLSESERSEFEAHYFECALCLEQLEMAEDFGEGMRQVALEEIAPRLGLLAALARLSRGRRLALGSLLLLLLALPLGWLIARNRGLERQLAEAGRPVAADPRVATLEADRRRLEDELARERQSRAASGPQVNVPVFLLAAVRSGEEPGREPVNRLPLSNSGSVILTLELATVDFPAYRAALHGSDGKEIWQADGLRPDGRDALTILLPAAMLPPGDYRLTLEGTKTGKTFTVGVYPFRVVQGSGAAVPAAPSPTP